MNWRKRNLEQDLQNNRIQNVKILDLKLNLNKVMYMIFISEMQDSQTNNINKVKAKDAQRLILTIKRTQFKMI